MNRTPVVSSNIKSIGYEDGILEVEFASGVYRYSGVTAEEHAALLDADSIGSHFHKGIKSKYPGVKQEPEKEANAGTN